MGYAIAQVACEYGWEVDLISGPVSLAVPAGANRIFVETAEEMRTACGVRFTGCDLLVMAAAVCDHRPVSRTERKLKKNEMPATLQMETTPDILAELGNRKAKDQVLVGFAAETDDCEGNGKAKLQDKNLDWIVVNEVGVEGRGFASDQNEVTLLGRDGSSSCIGPASKLEVASLILQRVFP